MPQVPVKNSFGGGEPSLKSIILAFPIKPFRPIRCKSVVLAFFLFVPPPVVVRSGTTIMQGETAMQQVLNQHAVTNKRQFNAGEITGALAPRYRVTLVCEEIGGGTPLSIQDSTTEGAFWRFTLCSATWASLRNPPRSTRAVRSRQPGSLLLRLLHQNPLESSLTPAIQARMLPTMLRMREAEGTTARKPRRQRVIGLWRSALCSPSFLLLQ